MQSIANFLRKWRKEHGYTQQQMADFLMVHRTTYTDDLLGRKRERD